MTRRPTWIHGETDKARNLATAPILRLNSCVKTQAGKFETTPPSTYHPPSISCVGAKKRGKPADARTARATGTDCDQSSTELNSSRRRVVKFVAARNNGGR